MLGIHDLALFIVSGLLLNMMPGPDSLLIMLRSGSQGWRAGSVAALGIGTVIPPFFGALKSRGHAACAKRCFGV